MTQLLEWALQEVGKLPDSEQDAIAALILQQVEGHGSRVGRPSAIELRRLPAAERDAILAAQASLAEAAYRGDHPLTDFEAFGEDDPA